MKSLDSVGERLNNLIADGLMSNESVIRLMTILERTWLYFDIFEKTLQADEELKATTAAYEAILQELEAIKAKKEKMADLDRQNVELQSQRSTIAFELERDFKANKPWLAEYATSVKQIQALKADKRTQQAKITLGEVKWLELKVTLEAFLSSTL
ncbi:hypothetical protein ACFX2I_018669 [Malus domestica]